MLRRLKAVIRTMLPLFLLISYLQMSNCFIINGPHNFAASGMLSFSSTGIAGGNIQSPILQATMGFVRLLRRKPYSGMRVSEDSTLKVSWYMYTVTVVEEDSEGNILNCEIIDTVEGSYRENLLLQLSNDNEPEEVTLEEILEIMNNCQKIKSPLTINYKSRIFREHAKKIESLSVLRAIVPGTRWCGVSDSAFNYHDLGPRSVDKCCRTHDFCPESLIPMQTSENITNPGPFTRSHCLCDEYLKQCLIDIGNEDSKALGNVYFNLLKIPCIDDTEDGKVFRSAGTFPVGGDDTSEEIEGSSEE